MALAAAFRERFSRQRLLRRSSAVSPPAVDVCPPAAVDAAAASMAGVLEAEGDGAAVPELIQTASPLRDH